MSPTQELYSSLQIAYEHFNERLFDQALPAILFTAQRQKGMMGYFAPNRWKSDKGNNCHEIAINPSYISQSTLLELMQTLVHEMVHCWQHCYGKQTRKNYHDKEWAAKMEAIGLMPSTTGQPSGKKVGQKMNDYPIPEGRFIKECVNLLKDKAFKLPWIDRFSNHKTLPPKNNEVIAEAMNGVDQEIATQLATNLGILFGNEAGDIKENETNVANSKKKKKIKYSCPGCRINVWGKSNLALRCEDCDQTLMCLSPDEESELIA